MGITASDVGVRGGARRRGRTARAGALVALVTLVAAGCADGGTGGGTGGEEADSGRNADATSVSLTISANAIAGGKNEAEAAWIEDWVIPEFTAMQKEQGVDAEVTFEPSGVDDEDYKTKLALDLRSGSGADIMNIDGIWLGEFAEAGYVAPVTKTVGEVAESWDGWAQIPDSVQEIATFEDARYGIPAGTDGRVIFFNKQLFAQAGLPDDWQPTSWAEILEAAEALSGAEGVTPLQVNAGTAMGEATSMQGFLPLLVGTGAPIFQDGSWQGASEGVTDVLQFYSDVYSGGLGDPLLQQEAQGRDQSFALFAEGRLGMLIESDYLWRSVVNPDGGIAPMAERDSIVGWAKIPAQEPGSGVGGKDFVSMSGGSARVINPGSEYPQQAWELLTFMNSPEAYEALLDGEVRITPRDDVNAEVLAGDSMLTFIADEVLPIASYRPGLAAYPQVSTALQEATSAVVAGTPPGEAADAYAEQMREIVGDTGDVSP